MSEEKNKCCVCGEKSNFIFNVNFKQKHICDPCATTITKQQIDWWSRYPFSKKMQDALMESINNQGDNK